MTLVIDQRTDVHDERITVELSAVGKRFPDESDLAVDVCNMWMSLASGRNYYVLQLELQRLYKAGKIERVPSPDEIRSWRKRFDWDSRCAKHDLNLDLYHEYMAYTTFSHPLANNWGRVDRLIRLAEVLEAELNNNLILTELKKVKGGQGQVTVNRLNRDLIIQFREVLRDIAAETGGMTGVDPKRMLTSQQQERMNVQELTDEQLTELSNLIAKMSGVESDEDAGDAV